MVHSLTDEFGVAEGGSDAMPSVFSQHGCNQFCQKFHQSMVGQERCIQFGEAVRPMLPADAQASACDFMVCSALMRQNGASDVSKKKKTSWMGKLCQCHWCHVHHLPARNRDIVDISFSGPGVPASTLTVTSSHVVVCLRCQMCQWEEAVHAYSISQPNE